MPACNLIDPVNDPGESYTRDLGHPASQLATVIAKIMAIPPRPQPPSNTLEVKLKWLVNISLNVHISNCRNLSMQMQDYLPTPFDLANITLSNYEFHDAGNIESPVLAQQHT